MLAYNGGVVVDIPGAKVYQEAVPAIMVQQPPMVPQPPVISFLPHPVSMPPSPQRRQVVEATSALSEIDLRPWLEAARNFDMNTDFDVQVDNRGCFGSLDALMDTMKAQSDGKWTIQALADKIMLSRMMDNLGVPQMPALLIVERPDVDYREIESFVLCHLCGPNSYDVVVKPTHMSNAAGVINVSRPTPSEGPQMTIDYLAWHLKHFMQEKAGSYESAALQSTRPGFIVQPKYESVIDFKAPLEVRIVVLWGKARLAVWWWGHAGSSPHCHRNVWLVRSPAQRGELSEADTWKVIHMHQGSNPGFNKAIELFERHITAMADLAEAIATAVGAPFLRSDFFVGSPQWGVRLNEVAYGSGIEYVNYSDNPSRPVVDDSTAIAQILREGFAQCKRRRPSSHFLSKLGIRGHGYSDMSVVPIPPQLRPALPPRAAGSGTDPTCLSCAVPEDLCVTVAELPRIAVQPHASVAAFAEAEVQGSNQWTPRQSLSRRSSPSRKQSPSRLTPRQMVLSPRRPSQAATPPPAGVMHSPLGSACMPSWSSGAALPAYQTSGLAAPATPTSQTRTCRLSTPTRPAACLVFGPQRGMPSLTSIHSAGDAFSRAGYPTAIAPPRGEAAAWSGYPVGSAYSPAPPSSAAQLPAALGGDPAPRRSIHAAAGCSAAASAAPGVSESLWRSTQQGASIAAIAAPDVHHTPPSGFRGTSLLPGAPARTPPPSWRSVSMSNGDIASTIQAARAPRASIPSPPSWQAPNFPPGLRTPPPPPSRRSLVG